MTHFKLDFSKLFELQVLLIAADLELLHLCKQMLLNLGIRKIDTIRQLDDLATQDKAISADIVLLDFAVDTRMTGGEILDWLVQRGLLLNRTRLVLMSDKNDHQQYAIEYPYHQISQLERPFNKVKLDQELKQHVMFTPLLRPLLTLAGCHRFSDCLKLLLHTQSQPMPAGLEQVLLRLRVQLLLDLNKFDAVLPLLKTPIAERQGWALWALYRIRYERGDLPACQAFLQDDSGELILYIQRRELWQIYLAFQEHDYPAALQIVNQIPVAGMSFELAQLVHLVFFLSGDFARAHDFIERKRRLAVRGDLYVQLGIAQTRAAIWRLQNCEPELQAQLQQQIESLLLQMREDKSAGSFHTSLCLLEAQRLQYTHSAAEALQLIQQRLQDVVWAKQPVSLLCHAVAVFADITQSPGALDLLYLAHQQLQQMPDNCQRLFNACLYQHTFDQLFAPSARSDAYQKLAGFYLQDSHPLSAAKLLRRACRYEPKNQKLRQQLYSLMQQLGIQRFRGINLPQELGCAS